MEIYTFLCVDRREVPTSIDVQVLSSDGYRPHAQALLRDHESAVLVEVWRGDETCELVLRPEPQSWRS
jgi:hypothetical protein